jgi:hypothetical protein
LLLLLLLLLTYTCVEFSAGGGGCMLADAETRLDIADSTFVGNRATSSGGCFALYGNSVTSITNSTISSSYLAR